MTTKIYLASRNDLNLLIKFQKKNNKIFLKLEIKLKNKNQYKLRNILNKLQNVDVCKIVIGVLDPVINTE